MTSCINRIYYLQTWTLQNKWIRKVFSNCPSLTLIVHLRDMYSILLSLSVPPNIISPVAGFTCTVNTSDPVTFQCTASGIPPPLITFYNSYGPLSSDADPRVILSDPITGSVMIGQQTVSTTSRNLTINSTRDKDSGNYTCVAFSNIGATFYSNQTFRLFVQCMPPYYACM